MKNIRKTVGMMPKEEVRGLYVQVHYNMGNGEVYGHEMVSIGHNSYIGYDDPNIIFIKDYDKRVTMRQVREDISNKLAAR